MGLNLKIPVVFLEKPLQIYVYMNFHGTQTKPKISRKRFIWSASLCNPHSPRSLKNIRCHLFPICKLTSHFHRLQFLHQVLSRLQSSTSRMIFQNKLSASLLLPETWLGEIAENWTEMKFIFHRN